MTALAIGIAIFWIIAVLKGKNFTIQGLPSILLMGVICYGLGSLVLAILKR